MGEKKKEQKEIKVQKRDILVFYPALMHKDLHNGFLDLVNHVDYIVLLLQQI